MMGLEEYIRLILDDWFVMSGVVSNEELTEHLTDTILDAVKRGEIKELRLTTERSTLRFSGGGRATVSTPPDDGDKPPAIR